MGIQDLENLFKIKKWIMEFERANKSKFHFIIDTDTQEGKTRIMINQKGRWYREPNLTETQAEDYRAREYEMYIPDLADFEKKLIIEYQEEGRKGRGAHIGKKGHTEFSDEDKDLYYKLAGFKQLKLWQDSTEKDNKNALFAFLSPQN